MFKKIFERMFYSELRYAASKNFQVNLTVMFVGCLMLTSLSLFVTKDGGFGVLFAGLLFWHRYVMLKVSKVYLEADPSRATAGKTGSNNADT
ncbi:hypothetical protein PS2015_2528 [Pseudohongiella spirulinae]|uniref:Uncharacterized protein n=1 Tax=Pseudohongiella spirulinae TaxID=1249552 RepID=A0A0S2KFV2_9GAMM|nr:hypothetical protein PS2015_2528 [Pseudohongiella spirulinae]